MSAIQTIRAVAALALVVASSALLAGCEETGSATNYRAFAPISPATEKLIVEKGSSDQAPMLIRAFKKEAELEVWKRKQDGTYVHLKTFPMCRWSGQLGPKMTEGDRQVPEGFYTITPGQMNPNSHYYLSFNVGYPNAYDRANGRTGGSIMVHGICSSAGCFSMTDKQIEEIYALARESFAGGQRAIQMQSFPFHMTAENLAKMRLDPNMPFWRELKKGSDHFEVTKVETPVGVCNKHYVFGATPKEGRFDALSSCPPLTQDPSVKAQVAEKEAKDNAEVAALVGKGVKPVRVIYADGGQNAEFAHHVVEVSRPDALAAGATEIVLEDGVKSKSVAVQVAAAKANAKVLMARGNLITGQTVAEGSARQAPAAGAPAAATTTVVASTGAAPATTGSIPAQANSRVAQAEVPAVFGAAPSAYAKVETPDANANIFKKWLSIGAATQPEAAPVVQAAQPVIAPAPVAAPAAAKPATAGHRRPTVQARAAIPHDQHVPVQTTVKPEQVSSALPKEIVGEKPSLPRSLMALMPGAN